MKFSIGSKNINAGVEISDKIAEKIIEEHEKNWKEKFDTKHKAKIEMKELRHKQKLELEDRKPDKKSKYQMKIEEQIRKEQIEKEKEQKKNQQLIRNIGIVLLFVFGLFCLVGFQDGYTIAATISLLQICLVVISILMCEDVFHLFKNDYKVFFIMSIILIVGWCAFAV